VFVGSNSGSSSDPNYTGGNAYRLAPAPAGTNGGQPNPSQDFCAAAAHFIFAGIATTVAAPPRVAFQLPLPPAGS